MHGGRRSRFGATGITAAATILACCATTGASAADPAAGERAIVPGVTLAWTAVPEATTVAVRLWLGAGLEAERQGTWGLATAALAGLVYGPTAHMDQGEALAIAARGRLHTAWGLGARGVHVTVVGPPDALDRALWLAAERLDPRPMRVGAALARMTDADNPQTRRSHALGTAAVDCTSCTFGDEISLALAPVTARGPYLSPSGDPLDHAYATLFGPLRGHTPWASRRLALEADEGVLGTIADEARMVAPARITVAGPPDALHDLAVRAEALFADLPERQSARWAEARTELDRLWERERPARSKASHDHDGRRFVTLGYDLRGVAARLRLGAADVDAIHATVEILLGSEGGLLDGPLVHDHALARALGVALRADPPALLLSAEVRGRDSAEARRQLLDELARITERGPPQGLVAGARRRARLALERAWRDPATRIGLVARWRELDRIDAPGQAAAYYAALTEALQLTTPARVARWAGHALHRSRRVIAELSPTQVPAEERVVLDAEAMDTFLRLLVDLRCPPPGRRIELVAQLDDKYGMTPEDYVALTRVVARDPARMRELNLEAEHRCLEYRKLRAMMPPERVVALHRAVACEAGGEADAAARQDALDGIYARFDIDPSVYRPMVTMAREDLALRAALDRIDAACEPAHGPATELR